MKGARRTENRIAFRHLLDLSNNCGDCWRRHSSDVETHRRGRKAGVEQKARQPVFMHWLAVDGCNQQTAAMTTFVVLHGCLCSVGEKSCQIARRIAAIRLIRGKKDLRVRIITPHVANQLSIAQNDGRTNAARQRAGS